jgi:hypothetical protein
MLARSAHQSLLSRPVQAAWLLEVRPLAVCFVARQQVPLVWPQAEASFAAQAPLSNLLRVATVPIGPALPGPWALDPPDFDPPDFAPIASWVQRREVCWRASIAPARLRQRMPAPRRL